MTKLPMMKTRQMPICDFTPSESRTAFRCNERFQKRLSHPEAAVFKYPKEFHKKNLTAVCKSRPEIFPLAR